MASYIKDNSAERRKQKVLSSTIEESDFSHIVESLSPADLQHLFSALGILQLDIQKAEAKANTTDVNLKGKEVLRFWKQRNGKKATWNTLLGAFEKCQLNQAKDMLEDSWKQKYSDSTSTPYTTGSLPVHHGQHDLQNMEANPAPNSAALPQQPNLHFIQPVLPASTTGQQSVTTTPAVAVAQINPRILSFKNLKFDTQLLGEGAYGTVSSVKFTFADGSDEYKGFKEAAAKYIPKKYIDEAHTMQTLDHHNIVRVLGVVDAPRVPGDVERCYIIMEKGEMSLYKYLQVTPENLTIPLQDKWALAICEAVQYIHSKHIVHRDIKPENVIVFQGDIVKLADFGISKEAITTKTTVKGSGTPQFIAPEVNKDNRPKDYKATFSKASDIYSLGVLLWQLFAKRDIPATLLPSHMDPYDFPESLKELLPQTWQKEPHDRPDIVDIISALKKDLGISCEA